jgi:hypothetical protein
MSVVYSSLESGGTSSEKTLLDVRDGLDAAAKYASNAFRWTNPFPSAVLALFVSFEMRPWSNEASELELVRSSSSSSIPSSRKTAAPFRPPRAEALRGLVLRGVAELPPRRALVRGVVAVVRARFADLVGVLSLTTMILPLTGDDDEAAFELDGVFDALWRVTRGVDMVDANDIGKPP